MKRQSLVLLAVAFVAAGAAGCFKDPVSSLRNGPSKFSADHSSTYLRTGDSTTVVAYLEDAGGNQLAVTGATWTSGNSSIAVVRNDTTLPIPGNAFTRGVIRAVDSVAGGWTNVIVSARGVSDTIRVVVMPAKLVAGHVAVTGPILTDSAVIPPSAVSGTPVAWTKYTAGDTLVLSLTSFMAFDTSKVTISVGTSNGAVPGYIVSKAPQQIKAVFGAAAAGKALVRHFLFTPGNTTVGTIAMDTLFTDSVTVAAWHLGGATFGGSAAVAGDTLTVTAPTNAVFGPNTLVTLTSATDTVTNIDTLFIIKSSATSLSGISTQSVAGQRVTLRNVTMAASGTGVDSVTFDSLKNNNAPYGIAQATLPSSFVTQSGIQLNITAAAPVSFAAATAATFDTNPAIIISKSATTLSGVLSPVAFTGPVTVLNAKVYSTVIPVLPTKTSYTMPAFALASTDVNLGGGRLGDTVTVSAPAGITFTDSSRVLLGNRAISTSDTSWALSFSGSLLKVFAKRGGTGGVTVSYVDIGAGVIAPQISTISTFQIDSEASDFPLARTKATAHAITIPASNVDTLYGSVLCEEADTKGICYSSGTGTNDYWTFTTSAAHAINGQLSWYGTGNPYGSIPGQGAPSDIAHTADLDLVVCNASMACDETDATDLLGYAAASQKQPESGTSASVPAAQYWAGVIPFTGPQAVVYRLIITLQ